MKVNASTTPPGEESHASRRDGCPAWCIADHAGEDGIVQHYSRNLATEVADLPSVVAAGQPVTVTVRVEYIQALAAEFQPWAHDAPRIVLADDSSSMSFDLSSYGAVQDAFADARLAVADDVSA